MLSALQAARGGPGHRRRLLQLLPVQRRPHAVQWPEQRPSGGQLLLRAAVLDRAAEAEGARQPRRAQRAFGVPRRIRRDPGGADALAAWAGGWNGGGAMPPVSKSQTCRPASVGEQGVTPTLCMPVRTHIDSGEKIPNEDCQVRGPSGRVLCTRGCFALEAARVRRHLRGSAWRRAPGSRRRFSCLT